jgi:Tfp pilus assembly protein PilF
MNDLQNALEEDPNNSTYYLARAYVYHKQGNEVLAQEDVKRAQFCNPSLPKKIDLDSADTTSRVTKN